MLEKTTAEVSEGKFKEFAEVMQALQEGTLAALGGRTVRPPTGLKQWNRPVSVRCNKPPFLANYVAIFVGERTGRQSLRRNG